MDKFFVFYSEICPNWDLHIPITEMCKSTATQAITKFSQKTTTDSQQPVADNQILSFT